MRLSARRRTHVSEKTALSERRAKDRDASGPYDLAARVRSPLEAPKHRLKPVPPCILQQLRRSVARPSGCVGLLTRAARGVEVENLLSMSEVFVSTHLT